MLFRSGRDIYELEETQQRIIQTLILGFIITLVLGGIGMLKDCLLGYFDGSEYQRRRFAGAYELVSLQGTVVAEGPEGQPLAHLHAVLAGEDFTPVAGHLFEGVVGVTLELNLLSLTGPASRSFAPSGPALLQLERGD